MPPGRSTPPRGNFRRFGGIEDGFRPIAHHGRGGGVGGCQRVRSFPQGADPVSQQHRQVAFLPALPGLLARPRGRTRIPRDPPRWKTDIATRGGSGALGIPSRARCDLGALAGPHPRHTPRSDRIPRHGVRIPVPDTSPGGTLRNPGLPVVNGIRLDGDGWLLLDAIAAELSG
jgi:hypothetical protein